jgi:hypothetical protein
MGEKQVFSGNMQKVNKCAQRTPVHLMGQSELQGKQS